jgi:hypothetical protein
VLLLAVQHCLRLAVAVVVEAVQVAQVVHLLVVQA